MIIDSYDDVRNSLLFLGFTLHAIHAVRMASFYVPKLQTVKARFYIPHWVFFPAWLIVICCDAAFGVLFFAGNSTFDIYYNLNFFTYVTVVGLMVTWNWLYFNVICFYAVGMVGVMIGIWHILLLIFTILYAGQSWFVYLILAVPIAWTTFAGIASLILAVEFGPKLKTMKDEVGKQTDRVEQLSKGADLDLTKYVKTNATPQRSLYD